MSAKLTNDTDRAQWFEIYCAVIAAQSGSGMPASAIVESSDRLFDAWKKRRDE